MTNHQDPELRLVDGPCPRCGCHMVRLFDCDCGEVHSDYCVNCGRFTSLGATEHTEMSEYDAPCVKGMMMHDHPSSEQVARIDAVFGSISRRAT